MKTKMSKMTVPAQKNHYSKTKEKLSEIVNR